jgi:N-ethylmaleimide reductase
MASLFDPLALRSLKLPNRIAMAPLTRCRAGEGDAPQPIRAIYYKQRASAGLIITEATNISPASCAFEKAPGIYSVAQVEGWRRITDAVHAKAGRIFLQLWHCGRVGSDAILGGQPPLSPSGVNDDLGALQVWGLMANGRYAQIAATPSREMTEAEIAKAIEDYGRGAGNAIAAGFDGVEIHAANGYLPHQFMSPVINRRTDRYGGTLEKRLAFVREVTEAVLNVVDASKVGLRISPYAAYNNTRDPEPDATATALARMFNSFGLAYLHLADTNAWAGKPDMPRFIEAVKEHFSGALIGNGGISPDAAEKLIAEGFLDMVAFGRQFLSNPDLPERIRAGGPYTDPRSIGWYGGAEEGYTDYPALQGHTECVVERSSINETRNEIPVQERIVLL